MDLSRVDACLSEILGHGWVPPKVSSVSDILEYCELKLEGSTHKSMTMGSIQGNSDLRLSVTPEAPAGTCPPPLKPLEHAIKQVKLFLDSFEASREPSGEEECVILGADIGPCWDDAHNHEGVSEGTYTEIPTQNTPKKPSNCHPNTMVVAAFEKGAKDTPNTNGSDLRPWHLTAKPSKISPLTLGTSGPNSGISERDLSERAMALNIRVLDKGKVTTNSLEENDVHLAHHVSLESKDQKTNKRRCVPSSELIRDSPKSFKPHQINPHFHQHSLIKLRICLTPLEGLANVHEVNQNYGAGLRGDTPQLIPFTILVYDPGGSSCDFHFMK